MKLSSLLKWWKHLIVKKFCSTVAQNGIGGSQESSSEDLKEGPELDSDSWLILQPPSIETKGRTSSTSLELDRERADDPLEFPEFCDLDSAAEFADNDDGKKSTSELLKSPAL